LIFEGELGVYASIGHAVAPGLAFLKQPLTCDDRPSTVLGPVVSAISGSLAQ
jgi:hypothetical protein